MYCSVNFNCQHLFSLSFSICLCLYLFWNYIFGIFDILSAWHSHSIHLNIKWFQWREKTVATATQTTAEKNKVFVLKLNCTYTRLNLESLSLALRSMLLLLQFWICYFINARTFSLERTKWSHYIVRFGRCLYSKLMQRLELFLVI